MTTESLEPQKPDTGSFQGSKFKIRLNQTVIKLLNNFDMSNPDLCPAQIKETCFSDSKYTSLPTAAMMKGLVFENAALDLNREIDFPKLKNGNISADYERIFKQADNFKEIAKDHEIVIAESQKYIEIDYSDEVVLFGTLDFVGSFKENETTFHPEAIVDLKLTGNLFSTFGDYSWAFPYNINHLQAFVYNELYLRKYGKELPFFYMVFDYTPSMNHKIFKKRVDALDKATMHESIRSAVEKIKYFDENGWIEIPRHDRCLLCPINETCKSYTNKRTIEEI